MTERKNRLDESFNSNSLQKSISGQSTTSINLSNITISDSGNIVPVPTRRTPATQATRRPNNTNSNR